MKKFLAVLFVFLLSPLTLSVKSDTYDFDIIPYEHNETADEVLTKHKYREQSEETTNLSITAFEISQDGLLVICKAELLGKRVVIDVYDVNGLFLYGYSFESSASTKYPYAWWTENGNLNVVLSSGGTTVITFDYDNDTILISSIDNETDSKKYRKIEDKAYSAARYYNGEEFKKENPISLFKVFGHDSKITKTTGNGELIVLYDATRNYLTKMFAIIVAVFCFIGIGVVFVITAIRKYRKDRNGYYEDQKAIDNLYEQQNN